MTVPVRVLESEVELPSGASSPPPGIDGRTCPRLDVFHDQLPVSLRGSADRWRGRGFGLGFVTDRARVAAVQLDAAYDSAKTRDLLHELGCHSVISLKGFPLQAGKRWVIERTNPWHHRGFKKLAIRPERRARVIDTFIALATAVIITRRPTRGDGSPHDHHL